MRNPATLLALQGAAAGRRVPPRHAGRPVAPAAAAVPPVAQLARVAAAASQDPSLLPGIRGRRVSGCCLLLSRAAAPVPVAAAARRAATDPSLASRRQLDAPLLTLPICRLQPFLCPLNRPINDSIKPIDSEGPYEVLDSDTVGALAPSMQPPQHQRRQQGQPSSAAGCGGSNAHSRCADLAACCCTTAIA